MTVQRPALRYHGGKFGSMGSVADWIISHFPEHRVYVEPFAGAASVLLRKPRAYLEVYNDTWDEVVNVFRVLREPDLAAELQRRLELTPFARTEWEAARSASDEDLVERARCAIVRSFMGFGSASINADHHTGFRGKAQRVSVPAARDWANYPNAIASFTERLRGVVIECRPACDVIRSQDTPETLFYVDPPYLWETRSRQSQGAYAHDFTIADHEELAATLRNAQGMVVLSGYDHALYRELYGDWVIARKHTRSDGSDADQRRRVECLWLNPAAAAGLRQRDMFGRSA